MSATLKRFITFCLKIDPNSRPSIHDLVKHELISGNRNFSLDLSSESLNLV